MAQLLKIDHYISRYEADLFFYINRLNKLKHRRWVQMKHNWEWITNQVSSESAEVNDDNDFPILLSNDQPHPLRHISNVNELKEYYQLFIYQSQLKWASSTLYEHSGISSRYRHDAFLKRLLIELPDTYLVLYEPVIQIKQASVQLDIVIISPNDVKIIKTVKGEKNSVFNGINKHTWLEITSRGARRTVNPILSLDRSEKIVKGILKKKDIHLPITCIIYAPESYIEFVDTPQHIHIVDRRESLRWFDSLKNQLLPFKHSQFIAAKSILNQCQTTD